MDFFKGEAYHVKNPRRTPFSILNFADQKQVRIRRWIMMMTHTGNRLIATMIRIFTGVALFSLCLLCSSCSDSGGSGIEQALLFQFSSAGRDSILEVSKTNRFTFKYTEPSVRKQLAKYDCWTVIESMKPHGSGRNGMLILVKGPQVDLLRWNIYDANIDGKLIVVFFVEKGKVVSEKQSALLIDSLSTLRRCGDFEFTDWVGMHPFEVVAVGDQKYSRPNVLSVNIIKIGDGLVVGTETTNQPTPVVVEDPRYDQAIEVSRHIAIIKSIANDSVFVEIMRGVK